jgi:hypothetical protein
MELIELDQKSAVIALVLLGAARDQRFGAHAFLLGADHDRRAMRIIGAAIDATVPALLLKAHPDVGLHGLDDVAEVQGAVGVGQGAGDEYFARHAQAGSCRRARHYCMRARLSADP